MKLTPARYELLTMLKDGKRDNYASHYPPMKWALENGFAEQRRIGMSTRYSITPAGLAALAEHRT